LPWAEGFRAVGAGPGFWPPGGWAGGLEPTSSMPTGRVTSRKLHFGPINPLPSLGLEKTGVWNDEKRIKGIV